MGDSPGRAIKQVRFLTQALILSGALNISLTATFFYLLLSKDRAREEVWPQPAALHAPMASLADGRSNAEVLHALENLSFDQLIGKLNDCDLVEDGYTQRDLSLACLVHRFQFDLERALGAAPQQKRLLAWKREDGLMREMTVFPGLSEESFRAIERFATVERWPLTSKGLFLQLKQPCAQDKRSLLEAFFLTPEFLAVEALLSIAQLPLSRERIASLLREGDWQLLEEYTKSQRALVDLSPARRQKFLLDYAQRGSVEAAYLLLQTDGAVVAKKCDDAQVQAILRLVKEKTPEVEAFALELLSSPRSDEVWKSAAEKLFAFAGEAAPQPYNHQQALLRFLPEVAKERQSHCKQPVASAAHAKMDVLAQSPRQTAAPRACRKIDRVYIVQDKDSLWKIARRYQVSVDALRDYNGLCSEQLTVGQILKIPPTQPL